MIDLLVVNHRTAAEARRLVAAAPAGAFHVHLLENGSGPNDRDELAGVDGVVVSERNLGFAGGVNRLARDATGEWLLLMNPDVVPGPGLFEQVAANLPESMDVGVVGGVRVGAGPRSFGSFPGLLDRWRGPESVPRGARDVDWVSGCFMLVRRRVFEALGGLDEGYFLQLEDVDFCWRARAAGLRVVVDPRFAFEHAGHLAYARSGRSLARDFRAGKVRFLERSGRPVAAAVLRAVHALSRTAD